MSNKVIGFCPFIKRFKSKYLIAVIIICIGIINKTNAQNVNVTATLDSTTILIGGQIDLKLEVSQPEGVKINFPTLNDTITKNIEIVDKGGIDSVKIENNRLVLSQLYRITSFDSGLHYISPFKFELIEGELKKIIDTDPLSLMVVNPFEEVDPEKGLFDIKGVQEAPFKITEILNYIYLYGGILILLALLVWLYIYYRKKQLDTGSIFVKSKPNEPAHVVALRELDRIKELKLWEHNKVKEYYTLVSNTLREYIENRYKIPALEQTSIEIFESIQGNIEIEKKAFDQLKQVLELSDLVKFAKYEPLPDENGLSLMNAYFFVDKTKKEIIKTLEEEKEALMNQENSKTSE